jgi:hypothetical protein
MSAGHPALIADQVVVCVLGMHRSGTSLVSRMLNLLGVHLGSEDRLLPGCTSNPKGHWEHAAFVELNDQILSRYGGSWNEPPSLPRHWQNGRDITELRENARQFVIAQFAAERLWGWKDPRTCLTLPLWQELIGPMRYVVCVRNPRSVAASLARRDGMGDEQADRLWLAYAQASIAGTLGCSRLFVFYEDLIEDWLPQLRRMAAFVGHPERADDPRVREAVGAFLERSLCHHHHTLEDLMEARQVSLPAKALYVAIRDSVLTEAVAALTREREAAVQQLQEIHASSAWKIVSSSREVARRLFPAGSRRQRAFNSVVRSLANAPATFGGLRASAPPDGP